MPRKRELINLTITNYSNSTLNIPIFKGGVSSINSTTNYTWDITGASLSCVDASIIINGNIYNVKFDGTLDGLANAFTNIGFGFFSWTISGGNTYIYTTDNTNIYGDLEICALLTTTTTTTTTSTTTTTTTTPPTNFNANFTVSNQLASTDSAFVSTNGYTPSATVTNGTTSLPITGFGVVTVGNSFIITIVPASSGTTVTLINILNLVATGCTITPSGSGTGTLTITITPLLYDGSTYNITGDVEVGIS